ncbi:hypothetical protein BJ138DRAFT_1068928 [Hygrophoropsis aurantiaca]|uniref:Uncharacterized protein n=1 Tax=Hygrophoropsis aurantiaca TaxID=72124 RepID=A0ACB8A5N0_9AGAM|nr:hypothetical protein BJ138DRAFT_1068928 [Hygrophoropsis aurantiaca]
MPLTKSPFSNADVTDRILSSLPDVDTLHSAILASKSIYNVFHDRPHSTTRAVVCNQIGPALPQALRLVRCERANICLRPVNELPGEDELFKSPITPEEVRMLVEKAKVVDALEDLFSCREKDKRFRKSQLSAVESARFHAAMYRLWLFTSICGFQGRDMEYGRDDDEESHDEAEAVRLVEATYFASLTTTQLREIERVVAFLLQIPKRQHESHHGACRRTYLPSSRRVSFWHDPTDIDEFRSDYALFNGPDAVLKTRMGDTSWMDSNLLENFDMMDVPENWVSAHISAVLSHRGQREQAGTVLLDEVIGEDDRCAQCHSDSISGVDLWGPSNWHFTSDIFEPLGMTPRLKSRLQSNAAEKGEFHSACTSLTYPALLDEVFEYKAGSYSHWDKNDWLCELCLGKFVTDHLHLWYAAKRRQQTQTTREDCWYGYNCRTQTHYVVHAKALNHWCEPTKEDA